MRNRSALLLVFCVGFVVIAASNVSAHGPGCSTCCAPCVTYQTVAKTIMVPTTVMEQRTINCIQYRPVVRDCTVQVAKCIPETRKVSRTCTVMVPKQATRTEYYTVAKPVFRNVEQQYTVMVPHPVVKQGFHTVCKTVPVTVMKTICEDHGCWSVDPCGCCRVWIPKVVTRQVPVTCYKTVMEQVPHQYTVTVCKPEIQSRTVRVCDYEYIKKSREVPYTTFEPKNVTKTYNVTSYKTVMVEQTRQYTAMQPVTVQKVINVPVCHMVPKTVMCKVPVSCCGS